MNKFSIATIINFCTNESRFIRATIEQALLFSDQVLIPYCDHFFDGQKENHELIEQITKAFPQCQFIEYPLIKKELNLHSLSRLVAFQLLGSKIEYVLFLDADEIPDGKKFLHWLEVSHDPTVSVMKLANYWYFRDPAFQAEVKEDSIVFAKKELIEEKILLKEEERDAIYGLMPTPKKRMVTSEDGSAMFHHYSWVRTEAEMLKKVQSWGHKNDRDWGSLVKKEFAGPFSGHDFVHGYTYKTIEPVFEIPEKVKIFEEKGTANRLRLKKKDLLSLIKKAFPFWRLIFSKF